MVSLGNGRSWFSLFRDYDLAIIFKDTVFPTLTALVAGMGARTFDLAGATALTAGGVSGRELEASTSGGRGSPYALLVRLGR